MAVTTMTTNPQKITVNGTGAHEIDFKDMMNQSDFRADALIQLISGTSVQFNIKGDVTESSGALTSTVDKLILPVYRSSQNIKYKGGAGSEVFIITIVD
jgi:hypothetical protein